jgi:hypothetical protein
MESGVRGADGLIDLESAGGEVKEIVIKKCEKERVS